MADWDVVVIGAGPAGLSAAAAVANMGLSCLLIDRMGAGGELMNLGPLHGVQDTPTGPDLAARLLEEAVSAGAETGFGDVSGLIRDTKDWQITTDQEAHHARAVILAVGLAPGTLGLAGEADFEGRGLSHCAACDGPLYHGQPVAVAGFDRWAVQEARDLAAAGSLVTLITPKSVDADAFSVILGRIVELEGASGLDAVLVQPTEGGAPRRVPAQAVFVQTGRRPALDFAPDTLARDPDGRLITDQALQTGLPCLFAAGDARARAPRTIAAAIADGQHAAEAARAALAASP